MPGKGAFSRCVESVSSRGGVSDPRAVCAHSIGQKRGRTRGRVNTPRSHRIERGIVQAYEPHEGRDGAFHYQTYYETEDGKRFDLLSDARRHRGDLKTNPSYALVQAADGAGRASGRDWPSSLKLTTTAMDREFKDWMGYRWNSMPELQTLTAAQKKQLRGVFFRGVRQTYRSNPKRKHARRNAKSSKQRAIEKLTKAAATAATWPIGGAVFSNKGKKKKNPTKRTAHEAYKDFHGHDASHVTEFERAYYYPKQTSQIGKLIQLVIKVPKERRMQNRFVHVREFKGARLTENPEITQLYVEGGDTSVDLADFGIRNEPHEYEYLGELVQCVYHTDKSHLGNDGGRADYHHKFGKAETLLRLKKTELIKVGYHTPDEEFIFIGGGYEIPPEGIDG